MTPVVPSSKARAVRLNWAAKNVNVPVCGWRGKPRHFERHFAGRDPTMPKWDKTQVILNVAQLIGQHGLPASQQAAAAF